MRFSGRPVDASFFDTAPMRFKNVVELNASPAKVFAIFEDGESWPQWFRAIHKVAWTSNKPYGVGTTRTVWLTPVTLDEHFMGAGPPLFVLRDRAIHADGPCARRGLPVGGACTGEDAIHLQRGT